ncbi:DegT/DnrJ/EryC1/StrS family aminotransferase [Aequorivita lipolytica]|uniref:Aminotransferase class I/II-fold pyridoxal phosphate-dependent enzyme n=1 Tax=Aequorivita lipolytica TaxID=153267 RepID=A0A5C6YM91_9FLAO|nr:aminotransferase class I/II-fold pyridoxal phosphate-dependent enzyme [Aequorivita lipolytica]TXD68045.1 aminotransferase class I/II-fold pyridoxal phosphate-dependent enzyme [Aequorivita lipolytica]SRX53661.1 Putative pyridoxal phosphate-dependent aminotransferase EpsN [Aequorivita lipolytica]
MKEKIYLSSPHMGGSEQTYVNEAFETNWIAPLGPNVEQFEIAIENYLGSNNHVAALSSGTAAIHLALIMLGVERDDEVICQSFTFSASANPIMYQSATPIFVDSEPDTWNICPHHLEEAIKDRISNGKKPKAIIAVHLYGMPYKVDEVRKISEKYEIPVVEDSAEALGSSYKGQKCGTFGDLSILSFNGNKIITTSGGGALVSRNLKHKEKAIFLATQARDAAVHYQHSEIGYNYRLSNISAGIGRGQMEVLDKHVGLRRDMNQFYKDIFQNTAGVQVFNEPNADYFSNHWLSCILVDRKTSGFSNEDIRLAMAENNIECRPLWKPMHLQPVFKNAPYYGDKVSEQLFEIGLCLPSGSNLQNEEKVKINDILIHLIEK